MKSIRWMLSHKLEFIITITLLAAVLTLGWTHHQAASLGAAIGSTTGEMVGKAVGSWQGINEGLKKAESDARDTGLSAEDTTVQIKKTMTAVGNLRVLSAGVTLKNLNEVGMAYRSLSMVKGTVTFSVDLSDVSVSFNDSKTKAYIYINEPEPDLKLDWGGTQKLAEAQELDLGRNAEDGIIATLNSMKLLTEKSEICFDNYSDLQNQAREAAEKQIENLVRSISNQCDTVTVYFKVKGDKK